MATLANVITPVVNPSAAPATNTITAVGDQFAAEYGATYLLLFNNGSASPGNIVLDDPVSVTPSAATAFNPDVTVAIAAGEQRAIKVEANRFRASDGYVKWTYSADITHANSKVQIYRIN